MDAVGDLELVFASLSNRLLAEQTQNHQEIWPIDRVRITKPPPQYQKGEGSIDSADPQQFAAFDKNRSGEANRACQRKYPDKMFLGDITENPEDRQYISELQEIDLGGRNREALLFSSPMRNSETDHSDHDRVPPRQLCDRPRRSFQHRFLGQQIKQTENLRDEDEGKSSEG